jgi:hypothetical protein
MKRLTRLAAVQRCVVILGLGLALAGLQPGTARADILITLQGTAPSGSNTVYTYGVFLAPGFELDKTGQKGNTATGDLFTLYDFVGLVGAPTPSAALAANGFSSFTLQNVGKTPGNTAPTDDPGIVNISSKYTKATETNNPATGMNLFLGSFAVTSMFGPAGSANLFYAGASQKNLPGSLEDEHLANNVSQVIGPAAVPEPTTLLLAGLALPVVGGFLYSRRRKPHAAWLM